MFPELHCEEMNVVALHRVGAAHGFEGVAQGVDDVVVAISQHRQDVAGQRVGAIGIEGQFIDGMGRPARFHLKNRVVCLLPQPS